MKNLTQNLRTVLKFVAVLTILVVLNVLAERGGVQWDMTEADLYSITDRSRQIARAVEESTTLYFFHTSQAGRGQIDPERVRILLSQYEQIGSNITFKEVDHTRNPGLAREHNVQQNNVVLVQSGDRTNKLSALDLMEFGGRRGRNRKFSGESALSTALLKMTEATDRAVYFVSGHGEYTTDRARKRTVSDWISALKEEGYNTESFNPLTDDLPDTREMVVVLEPTETYSSGVAERLRTWRKRGGNLLVAAGPESAESVNRILEGTGIQLGNRQIIDPERRVQSLQSLVNPFVFAPLLESHPSLSSLQDQGLAVQMGRSAPLDLRSDTPQKLLTTSSEAISKPLTGGEISANFNPERDERGSFPVGALVSSKNSHVFAFGSASLFGNINLSQTPGNESFAVNLINWTFDRDVSLGIQATPADYNRLTVTAGQSFFIQIIALFGIPLFVLLWGGWVWWNRKNR